MLHPPHACARICGTPGPEMVPTERGARHAGAGVIAGVVSFCLAHGVKWILDRLSDRTNGFFGYVENAKVPCSRHCAAIELQQPSWPGCRAAAVLPRLSSYTLHKSATWTSGPRHRSCGVFHLSALPLKCGCLPYVCAVLYVRVMYLAVSGIPCCAGGRAWSQREPG